MFCSLSLLSTRVSLLFTLGKNELLVQQTLKLPGQLGVALYPI
jgi:hypothetical protein